MGRVSRLMGADEEGTLARLKAARKTVLTRPVLPIEVESSKRPVTACLLNLPVLWMQRGASRSPARYGGTKRGRPENARIYFRIGIHVGDIIIDDNNMFGDGVNIAARIENECEPGGVYF